jgi:hypothetical protein
LATIIINTNNNHKQEKEYIFDVIFNHFLGIEYAVAYSNLNDYSIEYEGKTLIIKDTFFKQFDNGEGQWLQKNSLPEKDTQNSSISLNNKLYDLPILYGNQTFLNNTFDIKLGLDIFGSSFFLLTRYEEYVINERDVHGRFLQRHSSLDLKNSMRPLVNEYVELFTILLQMLIPKIQFSKRKFRTNYTCDVDYIYDPKITSLNRLLYENVKSLLKKASFKDVYLNSKNYLKKTIQGHSSDPYNSFPDLLSACKDSSAKCIFFIMASQECQGVDSDYNLEKDFNIHEIIKYLDKNDYEIGIHPSYNSFTSIKHISDELQSLQRTLTLLGIKRKIRSSRQHYLRWETTKTPYILSSLDITNDYSLGYVDTIGFRSGSCYSYPFYDMYNREKMNLIIHPLHIMEITMFDERYMNLKPNEASLNLAYSIKEKCKYHNGSFSFLWHNSSFNGDWELDFFKKLLA